MGFSSKNVRTSWEKWPEVVCRILFCFRRFCHIAWPRHAHKFWACVLSEKCENDFLLTFIDDDHNDNIINELFLWLKQQLCTCISLFSTFPWRPPHDYDVKPLNLTTCGGRGHTTTNFPFSFWNWIKSLRIQLQEKSPAFGILSGSKLTRLSLKKSKIIFFIDVVWSLLKVPKSVAV